MESVPHTDSQKEDEKILWTQMYLHALFGALLLFSAPSPLLKHMRARQGALWIVTNESAKAPDMWIKYVPMNRIRL